MLKYHIMDSLYYILSDTDCRLLAQRRSMARSHRRVFSGRVDRRNVTTRDTVIHNTSRHGSRADYCRSTRAPAHRLPRYAGSSTSHSHSPGLTDGVVGAAQEIDDQIGSHGPSLYGEQDHSFDSQHTRSPTTIGIATNCDNDIETGRATNRTRQDSCTSGNSMPLSSESNTHTSPLAHGGAAVLINPSHTQTPNHQVEINENSPNEINLTLQNNNFSPPPPNDNYNAMPIPDAVSGYTITELPWPLISTSNRSQDRRRSGLNNNISQDYNVNNSGTDYPPYSMDHVRALSDIMACFPPEVSTSPAVRRERRHRQRRRRRRRSRHRRHRHSGREEEGYIKPPCCSALACKICLATCLQFKKVLVFFASFGVICVLIGIVLGVLSSPGNSFFTLSLMFVGEYQWIEPVI